MVSSATTQHLGENGGLAAPGVGGRVQQGHRVLIAQLAQMLEHVCTRRPRQLPAVSARELLKAIWIVVIRPRVLLTPGGQIRSTSTRMPSAGVGSS